MVTPRVRRPEDIILDYQRIINWYDDQISDGDYEGDAPSAIRSLLEGKNPTTTGAIKYIDNVVARKGSQSTLNFADRLYSKAEDIFKDKIASATTRSELQSIDRNNLSSKLKGFWTNKETIIFRREQAREKPAEELKGLTLSRFAKVHDLTEDEALDIIVDKGLGLGPGNKIIGEE